MLCLKCSAANPEATPYCGNCGSPLEGRPGAPMTMNAPGQFLSGSAQGTASPSLAHPRSISHLPSAEMPEQAWFAPVAHSPFSAEPLPQPSQPLPALIQPAGEIVTFVPVSQFSPSPEYFVAPEPPPDAAPPPAVSNMTNYPGRTQMPAPKIPPRVTGYRAPRPGVQEQTMAYPPGSSNFQYNPEAPDSAFAGPLQSGPLSLPGSMEWQGNNNYTYQAVTEEESYAALSHASPAGQMLGNVYPGPLNHAPAGGSPGQSSPASSPLPASEANIFVQPLPVWTLLLSTAAGALLLAALVFLNSDWASGAILAGLVSIILAILLLIAAGVRVALGMLAETNPHRRSQVVSTVLLVLLLFLFSGIGLTQQTGLHAMQAHYLEGQHSWQGAVSEYQAAGETAPSSENLARVYNEWGEALSAQHQYANAVAQFGTVLKHYTQVKDQLGRARNDTVATYLAWAAYASQHQDYAVATASYDTLLSLNYCSTSCQLLAQPKDATAYDHLAEQQLGVQQFAQAVDAFAILTTRFASSPEAKQAHGDYAKALWGLGQQQLNTTCSAAVPTYQQLVRQFADTDQGKQAATALQQPVPVKGHFTEAIPGPPFHPSVSLVQGLFVGIQQFQFPPLLKANLTTPINSDGTFTLASVPEGTYELVWSSDGVLHFYYASNGNKVLYTEHIGPLCAYDYGDINQAIPTGN